MKFINHAVECSNMKEEKPKARLSHLHIYLFIKDPRHINRV